jgi:hypothetical protein
MKIGSSMKIFVATKRGIKVLGNILIMSSMNLIIPQKIKFKYPTGNHSVTGSSVQRIPSFARRGKGRFY